jgi:hypothetical protein
VHAAPIIQKNDCAKYPGSARNSWTGARLKNGKSGAESVAHDTMTDVWRQSRKSINGHDSRIPIDTAINGPKLGIAR